jgi:hypothetical protein
MPPSHLSRTPGFKELFLPSLEKVKTKVGEMEDMNFIEEMVNISLSRMKNLPEEATVTIIPLEMIPIFPSAPKRTLPKTKNSSFDSPMLIENFRMIDGSLRDGGNTHRGIVDHPNTSRPGKRRTVPTFE